MYTASCLCAGIEIQITGPITDIIHCHCSKCRKASGSAYATNGFVLKQHLLVVKGESLINSYCPNSHSSRYFCQNCASPLYNENSHDNLRVRIRLGLIDSDIAERPASHNFVTSKANWDKFNDKLPHYKGQEPHRSEAPTAAECDH